MELPTSRSPECHIHCYDLLSAEMYCCSVSNNRGNYNVQGNSTAVTNNFLSVSHVCPCRTMTDVRHVPHPKFDPENAMNQSELNTFGNEPLTKQPFEGRLVRSPCLPKKHVCTVYSGLRHHVCRSIMSQSGQAIDEKFLCRGQVSLRNTDRYAS